MLNSVRICIANLFSNLPSIFPLDWTEQSLNVIERSEQALHSEQSKDSGAAEIVSVCYSTRRPFLVPVQLEILGKGQSRSYRAYPTNIEI